ncbi:hypothetical protein [Actinotalea ferrariae]|uniref:hypothetical protein n=1 Tax=Actinotalea ferrariae TaxID=1386098 RepID=UPI001C8BEA93|nr:hypothetical protein [Actinotalea ferrariae]
MSAPPSGSTSIKGQVLHHSVVQGQRVHAEARTPDWDEMTEDVEALEAWLENELGGLGGAEYSAVLGMWEDQCHPLTILNTVRSRRAA